MIIGYARTSKAEQNLDMQVDAIKKYAADKGEEFKLYVEQESGAKADRKVLAQAIDNVRKGDSFVVYKLDRLARSTRQLFDITDSFDNTGVEFVSISDSFDTTTPSGKAMFRMLAVFAEFERDIISDRTKAGLDAAKARGRIGGRPKVDAKTRRHVVTLYEGGNSATDIAKEYGIGRSTIYKILNESSEGIGK